MYGKRIPPLLPSYLKYELYTHYISKSSNTVLLIVTQSFFPQSTVIVLVRGDHCVLDCNTCKKRIIPINKLEKMAAPVDLEIANLR